MPYENDKSTPCYGRGSVDSSYQIEPQSDVKRYWRYPLLYLDSELGSRVKNR